MATRTPSGIVLPTFPERYITTKSGKTKQVEYKVISGELKATNDDQGIVEGYLNTIGNIDFGKDRTKSGAFKRTLDLSYKRKTANNYDFLWPYLWNHDTNLIPPGGIFDAEEDKKGLFIKARLNLDLQLGREMYSSYKFGSLHKQSMGYIAHQTDWTREDDSMIRELIEVEILEGSSVLFPMNDLAEVTTVKSMFGELGGMITETKAITGDTSLPIGPRDQAWDGSKAKKQIFAYAQKGDETLDVSKLKKCFMVQDGDPQQKGSWSYPFVFIVDGSPVICVGAAKAVVAAIGGARGAFAADGLKSKCETLYNRINKEYPDSEKLVPPWKSDGKGRSVNMQKKTVQEHYADEMCDDLLTDWQDVFVCALTCAILDAFKIGDQPEADVSAALDDFKTLVLTKFVSEALECDLSGYLTDNSYSPADDTIQHGTDSKPNYGYMSNSSRRDRKAGKPISATNQQKIDDHVDNLKSLARSAKSAMRQHVDDMHDAADSVAGLAEIDTTKSGRAISAATAQSIKSAADTMHDHADKAMSIMQEHTKAVRTAADDFANTMQGAEKPYAGDDPGKPDTGQQEGKSNTITPPQQARDAQIRSSQDTVDEEKELELALQDLKTWKAKLTI